LRPATFYYRAMVKRSKPPRRKPSAPAPPVAPDEAPDDQISFSNLSLHELFERQTLDLLERADLDEEQKQSILVAMSCPCCGAGGMSYTFKLKR